MCQRFRAADITLMQDGQVWEQFIFHNRHYWCGLVRFGRLYGVESSSIAAEPLSDGRRQSCKNLIMRGSLEDIHRDVIASRCESRQSQDIRSSQGYRMGAKLKAVSVLRRSRVHSLTVPGTH
jgi:hypothetical protein